MKALPALEGVSFFDGPAIGQDSPKRVVIIGDDGDPESDVESEFTQEWANMSRTRKRETGEIPCCVIAWEGGTDMKSQRDRAFVLLAACELALLADPTLGDESLWIEITSGSARPVQNERGAATVVPFTISYSTTL
jgi:hypothetical protein